MKNLLYGLMFMLFLPGFSCGDPSPEYDICVYGGTAAGVISAYTAKMTGKKVLLIEPGKHLGGMSAGGLGYTDIGNKYVVTGLARDFYRRIGRHYGTFEQWTFEPHVAETLFREYAQRAHIEILYDHRIVSAAKKGTEIGSITLEQSSDPAAAKKTIRAKQFIDCSYEGDLMARSGVRYTTGREANAQYGETYNGVELRAKHQFPDGIDPYKTPGKPGSGLLWGISENKLEPDGSGDKKIQAYNFRICLTDDPKNRIGITRPENYDPAKYELLLRYVAKKPPGDLWGFLKFDLMPNHKTDINNNGPISTDMIGTNYAYPESDYATREQIFKAHTDYNKGLLYFIGHDPRMPEHLRNQMLKWGYPKDEYTDTGNWSFQMYVREARRMIGETVMTQDHCEGRKVAEDGIGMAAYTMDSHNCQRIVVNGMVKNEGDVQVGGFGPYPIAYSSLTPKRTEATNLLVPVCLSASHIAYGSIRMEPVFMVLGHVSAIAASLAIDKKCGVQEVSAAEIRKIRDENPLADGSIPEILVDNSDQKQVDIKGNWSLLKNGYGPDYLVDSSQSGPASVSYRPEIQKAAEYDVYTYITHHERNAKETEYTIGSDRNSKTIKVPVGKLTIVGQTAGEWIHLGRFDLHPQEKFTVTITNRQASGRTIADAILLVPGR